MKQKSKLKVRYGQPNLGYRPRNAQKKLEITEDWDNGEDFTIDYKMNARRQMRWAKRQKKSSINDNV